MSEPSSRKPNSDRVGNSHGEVLLQEAAVPQQARPQLHANDAEDEEDEETEQEHIPQHGQRVEQQVHQDPHAWERNGRGGGIREAKRTGRKAEGWLEERWSLLLLLGLPEDLTHPYLPLHSQSQGNDSGP